MSEPIYCNGCGNPFDVMPHIVTDLDGTHWNLCPNCFEFFKGMLAVAGYHDHFGE